VPPDAVPGARAVQPGESLTRVKRSLTADRLFPSRHLGVRGRQGLARHGELTYSCAIATARACWPRRSSAWISPISHWENFDHRVELDTQAAGALPQLLPDVPRRSAT
jgi:hypothetical protein